MTFSLTTLVNDILTMTIYQKSRSLNEFGVTGKKIKSLTKVVIQKDITPYVSKLDAHGYSDGLFSLLDVWVLYHL